MENQSKLSKGSAITTQMRWATIIVVLLGAILFVVSFFQLWLIAQQWRNFSLGLFLQGLVWFVYFGTSVGLVLYPVRHLRVSKLVIQTALWPLGIVAIAGYYYTFIAAPIIVFVSITTVPLLVWSTLQAIGLIPPVARQTSLYLILVFASLVFANWGDKITAFVVLKWLQCKEDYSKLFELLRPILVRAYTYSIMAITYVAANIEKFSGLKLTSADWWVTYKDVLVEVLLTYVAIDSAVVIWKEFRSKAGESA